MLLAIPFLHVDDDAGLLVEPVIVCPPLPLWLCKPDAEISNDLRD